MNIHEYQAKELMRKYDIHLLNGRMAKSVEDACQNAKELGGDLWVVKA